MLKTKAKCQTFLQKMVLTFYKVFNFEYTSQNIDFPKT